ncbi:MAG: adenine phosphoribosyltransferase, partial [Mycobacterium sp.]
VAAAHRLLEQAGAEVATAAVVVELIGLGGRERVAPLPVYSLRRM